MNYKLELNTQEPGSNLVFNTIIFDSFKVNIVERYAGFSPKLNHVLFKLRTLDDEIIKSKQGNGRVKIKGNDFEIYQKSIRALNSYEYRNKLGNRKDIEQDYVHFILGLVVAHYDLN